MTKLSVHTFFKAVIIYILSIVCVYVVLVALIFPDYFGVKNLVQWDAVHYKDISEHGYRDFRVAFFPLFPKIWTLLGSKVFLICILNFLVYLSSVFLLYREFKWNFKTLIIVLFVPTSFYFFVPYSESFFFIGSTFMLLGIHRVNRKLLYLGLFVCVLARPAYTILFPALIILEFTSTEAIKYKLKNSGIILLIIAVGTLIVSISQFLDTGEWFKFFEAQSVWENQLQIPQFPLRSYSGGFITRLDGMVLLIGVICAIYLIIIWKSRLKEESKMIVPNYIYFSLLYVVGTSILVLIFRGGSLFSLNRLVMATPFFIVLIHHYFNLKLRLNWRIYLLVFAFSSLFWLLFESYVHIQTLIKFMGLSAFLMLLLGMKSKNESWSKLSNYLIILLTIQLHFALFIRYLDGLWVS